LNRNKTAPSVSVVIPCFNSERWVVEAINSGLGQGVPYLEVLVVNDGSTDKTQQIVQEYDGRVVLINQANAGVSIARREGVRRATGDYIKFLDSDDVLPNGALAALLDVAQKFPGNAVIGKSVAIGDGGHVVDGDGAERRSVPHEPARELGGEMLGVRCAPSVSEDDHLLTGTEDLHQRFSDGQHLLFIDLCDR
jgi:glycosyltransferase involved in cell wall biosynthesis